MRFLVDENLSTILADALSSAGHDAVHVKALGAAGANDSEVMDLAVAEQRVIISADTDFGSLLASTGAARPSTILVRELVTMMPTALAGILLLNLDVIEGELTAGAIAAFGTKGIRVRRLPLR
jgi:predicted nuclease of predicted toxin-antitoxin system